MGTPATTAAKTMRAGLDRWDTNALFCSGADQPFAAQSSPSEHGFRAAARGGVCAPANEACMLLHVHGLPGALHSGTCMQGSRGIAF